MNRKYRSKRTGGAGQIWSSCGDLIVRGHSIQIAQRYEELAREAGAVGDTRLYHIYLNYAEHWRKPMDSNNN